jgi:hypothetical protein
MEKSRGEGCGEDQAKDLAVDIDIGVLTGEKVERRGEEISPRLKSHLCLQFLKL